MQPWELQSSPVASQHVHVSWRAIFAGILVAFGTQVLLSLLGFAVGLTAFEPTSGVAKGVGIGVSIWLILTAIASVFAGAYFGSRVAGDPWKGDGAAHGVVIWAGFLLVATWLTSAGIGATLRGAAGLAAGSAAAIASPGAHDAAITALTNLGYTRGDAERMVGQARGQAAQAQAQVQKDVRGGGPQAREAVDTAAAAGAVATWVGFAIALLSLGGGVAGGVLGAIGEQKQVGRYAGRVTYPATAGPGAAPPVA